MTNKQMSQLVDGIKKPLLDKNKIKTLWNDTDFKEVVQVKPQAVAQARPQQVAQSVAQDSWVAQDRPQAVAQNRLQTVAQPKLQRVAQIKPQQVAQNYSLFDADIERFKEQIFVINGIEERKKFIANIGFSLAVEKRGKQYYYYGIKKFEGKKYRLYIGNVKS